MKSNNLTDDQKFCVEVLAEWVCGYHHLPTVHQFGVGICINYHGDLSTYDFDRLTRLVILAHHHAVRIEIASSGPGLVKIIAHRRKHGDRKSLRTWEYHPSLEDLKNKLTGYPCKS